MKNLLLAAFAALTLTACETLTARTDTISAERFDALYEPVSSRHDDWAVLDEELDTDELLLVLAQSQAVRDELEPYLAPGALSDRVPVARVAGASVVLDRHDQYAQELALDAVDRADYLRSTEILRLLIEQAAGTPNQ